MKKLYHKKSPTQPNNLLEGLNLQQFAQIAYNLFISEDFGFYIVKITFIDYQKQKYFLFYYTCFWRFDPSLTLLGCLTGFLRYSIRIY